MGFCIGAALAGAKPMTASSGPGLALYSESIGAAIMVEIPLVIVVVQRLGPSTGAATAGAQGDIQFVRWGTSGGYPIIALSPTDPAECYHLTRRAFALAERFRTPVFVATDKEVVMTTETVESERFTAPPAQWPQVPDEPVVGALQPFGAAGNNGSLRYNASSHDEAGYITKDPAVLESLSDRLTAKIEHHADELALTEADLQDGATTLVVSYGVTARSARAAVAGLRSGGRPVSGLTLYSLWPVPEASIRAAAQDATRVVVAELNNGQYRREIERVLCGSAEVVGVHRQDGQLIAPDSIIPEVVS
jgi:2-oxoglutarate ferredoxin oxidoreductase subunit alpha